MLRYDHDDRARLILRGPDRVRFLHGMVTCDVEKMKEGSGSRAAMLSVKGRLLAELAIYAKADELLLSMEGSLGEKVRQIFDKHIVMDDVEVVDATQGLGELGFYGEDAAAALAAQLGIDVRTLAPYHHLNAKNAIVARDPALGGVGVRVIGPMATLHELVQGLSSTPLAPDEYEVFRVEAGTARYGVDLDEERLVVEANLEDAISFDKGCYLGQEVVVRATTRGRVNRKLVGLVVSGDGPVPARTKLGSDAQPDAGLTTSSVQSVRMGGIIALAYVHRAALEADALLTLDGRTARAVELPFLQAAAHAARARLA